MRGMSTIAVCGRCCARKGKRCANGMRAVKNHDAVSNATRLERRQDVRDRIAFLVRQEEGVLAEKRKRIEETLWAIHDADIGDLWETYETTKVDQDGKAETDEEAICSR